LAITLTEPNNYTEELGKEFPDNGDDDDDDGAGGGT
jgi:hypothetical protein